MTKKEKRFEKMRQNPRNVAFRDLQALLLDWGFVLRSGAGTSHHVFKAELSGRVWTITVPFQKPHVNSVYVKEMLAMLEEIAAWQAEFEGDDEQSNT